MSTTEVFVFYLVRRRIFYLAGSLPIKLITLRFFLLPSLFPLVFLASIYTEPPLEVEKGFLGYLVHFKSCLVQGRVS